MNQTISYYNEHAEEFCAATGNADMSFCRRKFLCFLRQGGHILDAGCGSGRDARAFLGAGYEVTAMDASFNICKEAEKLLHRNVICMSFEEMNFRREFDGIWACASLLHIPKNAMIQVLERCRMALKENGVLYASFKYGQGERITKGRLFNNYQEDSLEELMVKARFSVIEIFISKDVRADRDAEQWVNVLAGKGAD
mgnify:CR=1 FL=1